MSDTNNSGTHREDVLRTAEQAARWLDRLDEDDTHRAAFFEWLKQSPRHVEEALLVSAAIAPLADLTPERRHTIESALSDSDNSGRATTILPLRRHQANVADGSRAGRWMWPSRAVLAAGLTALILGGIWLAERYIYWQTYTTVVGEQRALELEDGSVIHLNTQSRVQVHFSATARNIKLVAGEALFSVRHDTSRPFRVDTADARILAVGTQFDVYRRTTGTEVAVIEGAVQISPRGVPGVPSIHGDNTTAEPGRLTAGQETRVVAGRSEMKHDSVDLGKTLAWRQRRLVFRGDTLEAIAGEFNRYNRSKQVRVDGGAAKRHFAGTFNADDPEGLARALNADETLKVESSAREIVIRSRDR